MKLSLAAYLLLQVVLWLDLAEGAKRLAEVDTKKSAQWMHSYQGDIEHAAKMHDWWVAETWPA